MRLGFIRCPSECSDDEEIDQMVSDVFDELLIELSEKTKLHPSEQVNRDGRKPYSMNTKLYDFINSYHAYCKLCEQHFYCRSVVGDINSFFQNHVNTSYHRQQRKSFKGTDIDPILEWENPLLTARCHVCGLANLKSYVISTNFCIKKLMRHHVCVWPSDQRESNERFLKKLNLLKLYCSLTFFRDKFLRRLNGRDVCMLCGVKLPWTGERTICHLRSDAHYQKFCMFVWMNFNFAPKDLLNGFNLEAVTRWLIQYDPPVLAHFAECNELNVCLKDTNCFRNPYPEDRKNESYSPERVEMILRHEDIDFIYKGQCLLCNVYLDKKHFISLMHRTKAQNLSENSFLPRNYAIYSMNRQKRLLPYANVIENYERLREETKALLKMEETPPVFTNYIESLVAKKLSLLDQVISVCDGPDVFCQLCDLYMRRSARRSHLRSVEHSLNIEKWEELRQNLADERYLQPFKKVRNTLICLLCGALIHTNSFFAHMKGSMHARRMENYLRDTTGVPISDLFVFGEDFSCLCTVCNCVLGKNKPIKATLREIRFHWPCPSKKGRRMEVAENEEEMRGARAQDAGLMQAMGGLVEGRGGGRGAGEDFGGMGMEFVEDIVDAFEEMTKSFYLENYLGHPKLYDVQVKTRARVSIEWGQPQVPEELLVSDDKGPTPPMLAVVRNEDRRNNVGQTRVEEPMFGGMEAGNSASGNDERGRKNETEEDGRGELQEVLVIKGLPRRKRRNDVIYPLFETFGKIYYVQFESKEVMVAFSERGVASVAAAQARKILEEPHIVVMVVHRKPKKKRGKAAEKLVMDKELIEVLENPPRLMDFILRLDFEASKACRSVVEMKREEIVCNMIIHAVVNRFPACRCYPFGSRLTGLLLNSSDLDVFLDCGGMYEGFKNTSPNSEKKLIRTVANILKKQPEVADVVVVDNARVPIITFRHKTAGLPCDISFKNGLSIQNSLLIKFVVSLDWRVKPLMLFFKCWAKLNGLHGPPYFSSYALCMLVINYLEQLDCPLLPTIESLRSSYVGRRVTIGGWDCSINTSKTKVPRPGNIDSIPTLLLGMFEYYGNFDFRKNVVFPLTGEFVPRSAFSEAGKANLPMCFKRHILNIPAPIENLVHERFPICIIDPFDLSHVLTKSFTTHGLAKFVQFCQQSRQHLQYGMATIH